MLPSSMLTYIRWKIQDVCITVDPEVFDISAGSVSLFRIHNHYCAAVWWVCVLCVCPRRIERLAHYIKDDFGDNNITVLCVLKGGYKFCADLVEFIKVLGHNSDKYLETRVEFIRLKSYLVGGQDTNRGDPTSCWFSNKDKTFTENTYGNTFENCLSAVQSLRET